MGRLPANQRVFTQLLAAIRESDTELHRFAVGPSVIPRRMTIGNLTLHYRTAVPGRVRSLGHEVSVCRGYDRLVYRPAGAVILESAAGRRDGESDVVSAPLARCYRPREVLRAGTGGDEAE